MPETIKQVLGLINSLKDIANLTGNELSEKAILLSVHKVYVGQELVKLEYGLSNNKMIRKTEWGKAFSEASGTVTAKEIVANESVKEMLQEEIELERKIGILKNLRVDVSDVVSRVKSRLSQLRSDSSEH